MPDENATATYTLHPVSIPGFEGPLDLLLSLIEEGKMDIHTIALAAVTDQYLARVRAASNLLPEHLADFLVVAATLLLIKSRKLFPEFALTDDEEERIGSLEEQLREYRKFREAAKEFMRLWDTGVLLSPRDSFVGMTVTFYPPPDLGGDALRTVMNGVLDHLPRLENLTEEVLRRVVSIEDRIRDIRDRIAAEARTTFRALSMSASSKVELILSFLALLELVKQRVIFVQQSTAFQDILVSRPDPPTAVPVAAPEQVDNT